jgi:hypothetical protein
MPTVALLGFLRLYASPAEPAFPTVVVLHNPHVARSVLAVDGAPLGEVAPLGKVSVHGLPDGVHAIRWTTPSGFVRTGSAATTPSPAR